MPTAFAPPPNSYSIVVNAKVGVGVLFTQTIWLSLPVKSVSLSVGEIDTVPDIGEGVVVHPKLLPIKLNS